MPASGRFQLRSSRSLLVRACLTVLLIGVTPVLAIAGHARPGTAQEFPASPYLTGVEPQEASALIARLADAQAKLKAGEQPYFVLLSGGPAYYPSASISPRDAFLAIDWTKTLRISAIDRGNFHSAHRLDVLPDGFGKLVWEIRVWRNAKGGLERVELLNRPPSPY